MASKPKDPKAKTATASGARAVAPPKKNEAKDLKEPKDKDKDKDKEKEKDKDKEKEIAKDFKDQKEYKDPKDSKEQKDKEHKEQKDQKDQKETKDHKEQKDSKDQSKEHKSELKDHTKDFDRQLDKIAPENPKDLVESPLGQVNIGDPAIRASIEQRLATLEGKVATFIPDSSRPDLRTGALKNEPDRSGGGESSGG